jgi:hypothetical protein
LRSTAVSFMVSPLKGQSIPLFSGTGGRIRTGTSEMVRAVGLEPTRHYDSEF